MPASCAISTAAASAATTRTTSPTDAAQAFHHLDLLRLHAVLRRDVASRRSTTTLLGREAPYPCCDLPVVLGTLGGIGLIVGPLGLLVAKSRRDPALRDEHAQRHGRRLHRAAVPDQPHRPGAARAARDARRWAPLLAVHLGVVLALFLTLPYGKFVHGIYRLAGAGALCAGAAQRSRLLRGMRG